MYLKFNKILGANIYITSYFRDDRESNTIYPAEVVKSMSNPEGANITFEMYNETFIYMVPTSGA